MWSGVWPVVAFAKSRSALASIKARTHSTWPRDAAMCRAVSPSCKSYVISIKNLKWHHPKPCKSNTTGGENQFQPAYLVFQVTVCACLRQNAYDVRKPMPSSHMDASVIVLKIQQRCNRAMVIKTQESQINIVHTVRLQLTYKEQTHGGGIQWPRSASLVCSFFHVTLNSTQIKE